MQAFFTSVKPPFPGHQFLKPLFNWLWDHIYTLKFSAGADSPTGYTGANQNWIDVDGTNPPTVAALRFIDQTTGLPVKMTIVGGSVTLA